jgi:ribonuclease HI
MGSGCCKFQGDEADKWGKGAVNSRGKRQTNVHESAENGTYLPQGIYGARLLFFVSARTNKRHHHHEEGTSSNRPELGGIVLALQSAALSEDVLLMSTQRVRAGRATFLIKVKSHRGEPLNERADTLAEEGREISDDNKRWDVRTDRR